MITPVGSIIRFTDGTNTLTIRYPSHEQISKTLKKLQEIATKNRPTFAPRKKRHDVHHLHNTLAQQVQFKNRQCIIYYHPHYLHHMRLITYQLNTTKACQQFSNPLPSGKTQTPYSQKPPQKKQRVLPPITYLE